MHIAKPFIFICSGFWLKDEMNKRKKNQDTTHHLTPPVQKLMDMPMTARLVLGECEMEIEEILKLGQGSMLELKTKSDENLQLWINDQLIAKAKSVVVNDKIGAQITEIESTEDRLKDLTSLS